jgi:hypothetical protein
MLNLQIILKKNPSRLIKKKDHIEKMMIIIEKNEALGSVQTQDLALMSEEEGDLVLVKDAGDLAQDRENTEEDQGLDPIRDLEGIVIEIVQEVETDIEGDNTFCLFVQY